MYLCVYDFQYLCLYWDIGMEKGGGCNGMFVTSSICVTNDLCVYDVQNWSLC